MNNPPIRILLVEDDEVDRLAFLRQVAKGGLPYACRSTDSVAEARRLLAAEPFDVIILDGQLTDGLGLDLLPDVGNVPVIFVTGSESPEHAVRAMKCGANDYLLKDQDRNYLQLVPVAVDRALKQRLAGEELRESQELFRQSFNEAPIGKAFIAPDGRFLRVNRALCDLFGFSEVEFLTDGFRLMFGRPPTPEAMGQLFPMQGGQGRSSAVEMKCSNFQGHNIWLRLDVALVPDSRGHAPTYISQIQDITGQRHAEEERAQLEVQLYQAQKMEALGTLAGGVAHEFNNMLGIMLGYTELSKMDLPADHPSRTNLDQVMKAGQRAKEVIQQVLTFSRRQELKRELIDLPNLVHEAVGLIRSTIPATVDIRVEIGRHCPPIFGNATQLHQALMNLCSNASHAMGERGGRIVIGQETIILRRDASTTQLALPEGEYVLLSIIDNGHGMDAATLARIFEPFFTTKGPGRGSGLGMPVVHGIMKAHDGAVTVQSAPGKGTTVYLYFPVRSTNSGNKPAVEKRLVASGRGQRILLVDDELPLVLVGTKILERLGYHVISFPSPQQALEAFQAGPDTIDLVLTDLTMPDLTGLELATAMLQVRPALPIILASGFVEETTREQANALGIAEILLKPLETQILAEAVQRLLAKAARPEPRS